MEDSSRHVIPLAAIAGEFLEGGENVAKKIERSLA